MHWAETSIKNGNRLGLKAGILSTFLLGATFLFVQINEYVHIGFAPHDVAQASVFYGLTGLHGAHVFVGLTLLAMVVVRSFRGHYSPEEHRGVEVPGIYWHFVDVMWVVVYSTVYILVSDAPEDPEGPGAPERPDDAGPRRSGADPAHAGRARVDAPARADTQRERRVPRRAVGRGAALAIAAVVVLVRAVS